MYASNFININQFGSTESYGFLRLFVHELCHAVYASPDPNLNFFNQNGFDLIGSNVRIENTILEQMGILSQRIGYFSTFDNSYEYNSSYTNGNIVDYAFFNNLGYSIIDVSQSMQSSTNGLLVGSSAPELIISGNGNDYIWGLAGLDDLVGGAGSDTMFGGKESDTLAGGLGNDSIYGGASSDIIYENTDNTNSQDGGTLFGGSGNDILDTSGSKDASTVFGGSGNDVLTGNGASTLYGGSGIDEFHILTTSTLPGANGDTIVNTEGRDKLWINGIEVTENSSSIIYGYEIGGPGGGPFYVPVFKSGTAISGVATAPLAIVFRVTSVADGFTGVRQDIILDMYIYTNVSIGYDGLGAPFPNEQFYLDQAITVIRGVHLGDFGLFLNGNPGPGDIHNSIFAADRLTSGGLSSGYSFELPIGPNHTLIDETLLQEAFTEKFREKLEGVQPLSSDGIGDGSDNGFLGDSSNGSFTGGGGNDTIFSGGGSDTVFGGIGSDSLIGEDDDDSLAGDDGNDIIFGDGSPATMFQTSIFEGADSITGGNGTDQIYGNGGADNLDGGDDNDSLFGGSGNDTVAGGIGDDYVDSGADNDTIYGGSGNDSLIGGYGINDIVYGGLGDDIIRISGAGSIFGDAGNDTISGGLNFGALYGGIGNDTLSGTTDGDTLSGGTGNDSLVGGSGFDNYVYQLGDGNDTIYDYGSYTDDDVLNLVGVLSTSASYSRVNDDLVITLQDGSKISVRLHFLYSNAAIESAVFSNGVTVNLETVPVQTFLQGSANDDFLYGVDTSTAETYYAGAGNDRVDAYGGNDIVYGGIGNDLLYGGTGDDIIDGGTGSDSFYGGSGNDRFITDGGDLISESLNAGIDLVQSSVAMVLGVNLENLTLTGLLAINGTGNSFANAITGNTSNNLLSGLDGDDILAGSTGNDMLDGGIGNDRLDGGTGNDTLAGGTGNDTYFVDSVSDVINEAGGGGTADRVNASISFALVADDDIEVLSTTLGTGTTTINLTGNALAQTIFGNAGINQLADGTSAGAIDTLVGGAGNDTYIVRNAGTQIVENAGDGTADRIAATLSFVLAANDDIEILVTTLATGTAAINLTGNALAQSLTGNAGINRLNGGAGSDAITGGLGADVFVFTSALGAANIDTISDYAVIDDRIEIDNAVFGGVLIGALAATAFTSNLTGAATTVAQRVIYETDTGLLWYDADGTGVGARVQFASLTIGTVMAATEFTVV